MRLLKKGVEAVILRSPALRDDEGSRKLLTHWRKRFFAEFTVSLFAALRAIRRGANRLRMTSWNPFSTTSNVRVGRRCRGGRRGSEPLTSVTAGSGELRQIPESPVAVINPIPC
jgi:hypothetical protein